MVGKPNFPDDVDVRDDLKGSAVGTPGLTALDEERQASLADEGGASGAAVESQDLETPARGRPGRRLALVAALSVAAAALGVLAYRRWA